MDLMFRLGDIGDLPAGMGNILVVSGARQVGKTTYCQRAAAALRAQGLKVAGLLSPGRFENGQKTGFYTVNLATQETRLAASLIPGEIEGISLGRWTFDPEIAGWGNQCLEQAAGADLLIIDELGPLEFEQGAGWNASFAVLRSKQYRLALVVIRPECLAAFAAMGFVFQIKEINLHNRSDA